MASKPPKPVSTQSHLPFAAIEDGVVVMRDGSFRTIISVGSTNFQLKSEQEQNALVLAYQNFLNSLNYPIQIVMQSRSLDLEPYLKKLEATTITQRNELIKQQTSDYIAYVRELISVANIMDKKFFAILAYTPLSAAKQGLISDLLGSKKPLALKVSEKEFATHRDEILQRAEIVAGGLSALGLKTTVLDTDGVIRLLYNTYNLDLAAAERMEKPEELTGGVISREVTNEAKGDA